MFKTVAIIVLLGAACFAQAPAPTPSLKDHDIVVGVRYNDAFDSFLLGANAQVETNQGNTVTHAEVNVKKLLPENTEVHGLVGADNKDVYANAGASTNRYTNGYNFTGKGDVYYRKDNLTHLAEASLAKVFEVASVLVTAGEKNLNPYARALLQAAQEVAGFTLNETASLHFENKVFGNQLVVNAAKSLCQYLDLFLRGELTDLKNPEALARAVLRNLTLAGADIKGYAQASYSTALAYEAAVEATKLIAERFATRAFAGVHQTSPFAGAETSFNTDLANITAGLTANYTLGALYNAYARATKQFSQNLNALLEGSVTGANLQNLDKTVHGSVNFREDNTKGHVYANADGVLRNGQFSKSAGAGVYERLSETDVLTDDLTYDVNSVLNNRASVFGTHSLSNLLFNYILTAFSDNRSGSFNNVLTAAANTTFHDNYFAGVRGFYEKELQGLGAYLATRGNVGNFAYKAGVAGDVNSTKATEVRGGALLTGLVEGLNLTVFANAISDITADDLVTLSGIIQNQAQSLTVTGKRNIRGSRYGVNEVDGVYTYNINSNLALKLRANKTDGRKAFLEGSLSRVSGAQNVLLYFSVDEFGVVSFAN